MSALSLNCDVNYVKETYIKLIKTSGRDGFKSIRGLNSFFVMFTFDICSDSQFTCENLFLTQHSQI